MTAGKKIEDAFETLNNGNVKDFKKTVKGMQKLTLALLLIAAEDEHNTREIQNRVVEALEE